MKKLLALVLALVMTLSLCVTSNAAFSDAASINGDYTEAVDVMSAIGVLQGSDGKFDPNGSLTREQGAKIIAYMVLGTTAADALSATKAPFADVAADRWSAGAIQYCVSQGIIAGVGDNKFDPAGALTGYAFAKMALTALGYNASFEGFTGAEWQMNTAKRAITAGLTGGLTTVALSQPITREQAAQMALNTLKGNMVYYPNAMTVTTGDGTSVRAGTDFNWQPNEKEKDYRYPTVTTDNTLQLCELSFPTLKRQADTDDFGAIADKWTFGGATVGTYTSDPVFTYTKSMLSSGAANSTIKADLTNYSFAAIKPIENGVEGAAFTSGSANHGADVEKLAQLTGNGKVVDVYADDNGVITNVVVKNYNLFQVTSKTSDTVVLKGVTVTAPRVEVTASNDNKDFYTELSALAVDDYAMLAIKADLTTILGTEKFTTVTGAYTASSGSGASEKRTVGGTAYTVAANKDLGNLSTLGSVTEYTAYLDANGYLVYAKANNAVTGKLAFLVAATEGGDAVKGFVANARLIFQDGTSKTVQVNQVTTATGGVLQSTLGTGDKISTILADNDTVRTAFVAITNVFVKYTLNADGTYDLSDTDYTGNLHSKNTATNGSDIAQVSGTPSYGISSSATDTYTLYSDEASAEAGAFKNNSGTVLVEKLASGYNAWKGVKNFPTITIAVSAGAGSAFYANTDIFAFVENGYAKMIYVDNTHVTKTEGDGYNYMIYTSASPKSSDLVDGKTIYTYEVLYNGVKTTVQSKSASLTSVKISDGTTPSSVNTVYANPVFDSNNYLTNMGTAIDTKMTYANGLSNTKLSLDDGTLTIDNSDTWGDTKTVAGDHDVTDDFVCVVIYTTATSSAKSWSYKYVGLDENPATITNLMAQVNSAKTWKTTGTGDVIWVTYSEDGAVSAVYFFNNDYMN